MRTALNIITLCILVAIFFLTGCATVYNPLTRKNDFIYQGFNTKWEIEVGKSVARDIEKRYSIINNPDLNERLQKIGRKIDAVSDRRDIKYTFKVIDDDNINAFTIFGGYIYVFKGALEKITSDSELACLIGHEIGHTVERHLAKQLQSALGYSVLSGVALKLIYKDKEPSVEVAQTMDLAYQVMALGYSRKDEIEADRLGTRYAKLAGYDPKAMILLLNRIELESKSAPLPLRLIQNITIISSHPQTSERIKAVKKEIENLNKASD